MSDAVTVSKLPTCDLCRHPVFGAGDEVEARFDFRTQDGRWANGCFRHWTEWRATPLLGTGRGQLLLLEGETALDVMTRLATTKR